MVKVTKLKKRRLFDEDADWTPAKGRIFTMKKGKQKQTEDLDRDLSSALKGETITDKEGLERAYQQGDAYAYGDTLYIAGSHTARDWFDDVTKIPKWQNVPGGFNPVVDLMNTGLGKKVLGTGDLRKSERYGAAEKALKANPNIKRVVGHSLGGSVALELQKNYSGLESRTYGAPVWDPLGKDGKVDRYRNWFDPVSVFDRSAERSFKANPFDSFSMTHDYGNIATKFTSDPTSANGWLNPDGSASLTQ
jgi:hypothetical protein